MDFEAFTDRLYSCGWRDIGDAQHSLIRAAFREFFADERALRRLLAARVAMPHTYYDDGEAQGQEHGIVIDFMREPVAGIDAKLCTLNLARAMAAENKTPNVGNEARA